MSEKRFDIVLRGGPSRQLTLESFAATADVEPRLIESLVAFGILEPAECAGSVLLFDLADVPRLQRIMRLIRDTGVNLAGVGIILDLLERLRHLERENQWLRGQN